MNSSSTSLAIGLLLSLTAAPLILASTPIATLTCQNAQGSKLTTAVYQFQIADATYPAGNFSMDISALAPLLTAQSSMSSFATCVLSGGGTSVTMTNVIVANVAATGLAQGFASTELPMVLPALTASQLYATANIGYSSLTISGGSEASVTASTAKPQGKAPAGYDAQALAKFRLKILRGMQSGNLSTK